MAVREIKRRIVIEGTVVETVDPESGRAIYRINVQHDHNGLRASVIWGDTPGMTVEDAPLALPTEPGTRFWGRTPDTDPQYWFVQDYRGCVTYCPTTVDDECSDLSDDAAPSFGLTRLPDPEEAP